MLRDCERFDYELLERQPVIHLGRLGSVAAGLEIAGGAASFITGDPGWLGVSTGAAVTLGLLTLEDADRKQGFLPGPFSKLVDHYQ